MLSQIFRVLSSSGASTHTAPIALPPPRQILTSAAAVLAFVALAALGGCGQSGALYLPQITDNSLSRALTASALTLIPPLMVFLCGQPYLQQAIGAMGMKE